MSSDKKHLYWSSLQKQQVPKQILRLLFQSYLVIFVTSIYISGEIQKYVLNIKDI